MAVEVEAARRTVAVGYEQSRNVLERQRVIALPVRFSAQVQRLPFRSDLVARDQMPRAHRLQAVAADVAVVRRIRRLPVLTPRDGRFLMRRRIDRDADARID